MPDTEELLIRHHARNLSNHEEALLIATSCSLPYTRELVFPDRRRRIAIPSPIMAMKLETPDEVSTAPTIWQVQFSLSGIGVSPPEPPILKPASPPLPASAAPLLDEDAALPPSPELELLDEEAPPPPLPELELLDEDDDEDAALPPSPELELLDEEAPPPPLPELELLDEDDDEDAALPPSPELELLDVEPPPPAPELLELDDWPVGSQMPSMHIPPGQLVPLGLTGLEHIPVAALHAPAS
ncbi:MAG TPA: hypothetical protein PK156_29295 [Polyangium sp.]|nr:hypothetical protein [Polyangium sp.]